MGVVMLQAKQQFNAMMQKE